MSSVERLLRCDWWRCGYVLTPLHSTAILTSSAPSEPLSYLTLDRLSRLRLRSPSSLRISTTRVWCAGSRPWQTHKRTWRETRAVPSLVMIQGQVFVCFKMIISSLKRVSLVRAMRSDHNEMSCDWCHNNLLSCSGIHRNAEEKREHHEIKQVLTWGKRESISSCEVTRAGCVRHLFSGSRGTFLQSLSSLHLSLSAVQSAQIPQRRVYCRTENTTRQSEEQHWRKQIFTMTSLLTVTLYS